MPPETDRKKPKFAAFKVLEERDQTPATSSPAAAARQPATVAALPSSPPKSAAPLAAPRARQADDGVVFSSRVGRAHRDAFRRLHRQLNDLARDRGYAEFSVRDFTEIMIAHCAESLALDTLLD